MVLVPFSATLFPPSAPQVYGGAEAIVSGALQAVREQLASGGSLSVTEGLIELD